MFAALFGPPLHAFRDDLRLDAGGRLFLRPRTVFDDAAMFAYASDPAVVQYLPWEPAPSVESVRPFLAESGRLRRRGTALDLAIILRETGEMVGQTDLMEMGRRGSVGRGQAELGYILARPHWGGGLMTEAARLTIAHGFGPLRLQKIIAYADQDNAASQRVMQKIGMHLAGGETRIVKGEQRPYVRYEITRAAWGKRLDKNL